MEKVREPVLKADLLVASDERAVRCQQMRAFKAECEKARKRDRVFDLLAVGAVNVAGGAVLFGLLAVALYFGSF